MRWIIQNLSKIILDCPKMSQKLPEKSWSSFDEEQLVSLGQESHNNSNNNTLFHTSKRKIKN